MPVPRDAQSWDYHPDPEERLDFGVDVGALLEDGETVAASGVVVALSAEAEALGLQVVEDPDTLPRVAGDGRTIVFWLAVDPARRAEPSWDGWGRDVPVSISWASDGLEPRTFQRDFVITVRDR
jgi:hypothetical protein